MLHTLMHQTTLAKPITLKGVGLHTGEDATVIISPSSEYNGLSLTRTDVPQGDFGKLRANHVVPGPLSTTVRNEHGVTAATIEHCLSALAGMGVTNAHIALSGPEMPILDGSALPFAEAIAAVGLVEQDATFARLSVGDADPAHPDHFHLTVHVDFPHPLIGQQSWSGYITPDIYLNEIAPARSFMQEKDVAPARAAGLIKGASLQTGVLFNDDGTVANAEGLRFADEPVRHKVLDAIGDLALANQPLSGRLTLTKPSHASNNSLLLSLTKSK